MMHSYLAQLNPAAATCVHVVIVGVVQPAFRCPEQPYGQAQDEADHQHEMTGGCWSDAAEDTCPAVDMQ